MIEVKPLRIAFYAGGLAALLLLLLFAARPVPVQLLALYGAPASAFERSGGLEMVWLPPKGTDVDEVASRFTAKDRTRARVQGGALVVDVPGVPRNRIDEAAQRLARGGLEFHEVLQLDDMKRLYRALGEAGGAAVDSWIPDSGNQQTEYYVTAPTKLALIGKLADVHLPDDATFSYEYVESDGIRKQFWRSYVLSKQAELDASSIQSAFVARDPNTHKPVVVLDFNRRGTERFAEVTGRLAGHKLAIVLGGDVRSAPVISAKITGGRASITIGGGDTAEMEDEANALAATLKTGTLPSGGAVTATRYVPPSDIIAIVWIVRVTVLVGGAGLTFLIVWLVLRMARPVRRRAPAVSDGRPPLGRIAITLLAPVVVLLVSWLLVPGLDADAVVDEIRVRDLSMFSVGALGIAPVVTASILVEIVALVVPSWRRARHRGPIAREPLLLAVIATTIVLVLLQGWFVTQSLVALELVHPGLWSRVAVIGALGVGTLALVIIAGVIRNHGLGNGYAALIASAFVIRILRGHMLSKDHLIALACMLAIAIAFIAVARWRIARPQQPPLRIPTSGIAPLSDVGGLALLIGVLSQLHLDRLGSIKLEQWVATAHDDLWIGLALVVLWTLAWSFLFARPRVFPAPRPSWQTWWDATAVTLVLLGFVGCAALVTIHARPTLSLLLDVTRTGVIAMFLLDCYDDFRVRRRNLDRVWTVHQAQHADLVEIKLADAGIPCHLASSHLRTMLAFFGPWAPIDVLVPTEHAPAARTLLSESAPL